MSEESSESAGPKPSSALPVSAIPAQNLRLELNAANLATFYSNFFRVTGTFEELILDFGLHTGSILPTGPEPVKFSQRLVLSFATAKRLYAALQVALAKHEQVFGTIEVDPHKRTKRG